MEISSREEDARLISRILKRDRTALLKFYRTYRKKLEKFIFAKIPNPDDAEEILQDTLFAFLDRVRDFEGKASISTFLFAVAQRKIADYYRRRRFCQTVFSDFPRLETVVTTVMSPEEVFDAQLLHDRIYASLQLLLPKYKNALISKYGENRSVAEIARSLSVSVKSAESILFRARKAFIKAFVVS